MKSLSEIVYSKEVFFSPFIETALPVTNSLASLLLEAAPTLISKSKILVLTFTLCLS